MLDKMHFTRVTVPPVTFVTLGLGALPDDGDTGHNEWILGQEFFAEAYASEAARDLRIGRVGQHIAFVRTDWAEIVSAGLRPERLAIGHKLGEAGFELVANEILPHVMAELAAGRSWMPVIIDRVRYEINTSSDGGWVAIAPLYEDAPATELDRQQTAEWLLRVTAQAIAGAPRPWTAYALA